VTGRLIERLPRGGGRLLLVTGDPGPLTAALEAAGWRVSPLDPAAEVPDGEGGFAAAVLLDGEPPRPARLAALRRRLDDRGRLLVALREDGAAARALTLALSEAGFVVLEREETPGPGVLFAARRDAFHVRAYREGDEARILALFRQCFHVERSLARWRWAFLENPYGQGRISEAFTEDGTRLVAHYAGYPVRVHRESDGRVRVLTALQIGDTMTEPSVRHVGRGPTSLLGRTVRHYYARFCEGQVDFNYGVNTGNIQRFSMSFVGARHLEALPYHVRETGSPLPVPHPVRRWLAGWRVERITRFDARFDALFRRAAGAYGLLIERDARYLEWRYARCPDTEYFLYAVSRGRRLAGWSVFRYRKGQRAILSWGDALFDPARPEAVPILLGHVLAAPEHRSARAVDLWLTDRPDWWLRRVRSLGFRSRPEPEGLGFVFVPFRLDPEEDFRARLYYMMGDTDLF
jgi:hypothetical protein